MIQMIDEKTFYLAAKGHKMTLVKNADEWVMTTENARTDAVRSYQLPTPKYFQSLKAVEKKYKLWAGISALVTN